MKTQASKIQKFVKWIRELVQKHEKKVLQNPVSKKVGEIADKTEVGRRTKQVLEKEIFRIGTVRTFIIAISSLAAILILIPGIFASSLVAQLILVSLGVTIGMAIQWLRNQLKIINKHKKKLKNEESD